MDKRDFLIANPMLFFFSRRNVIYTILLIPLCSVLEMNKRKVHFNKTTYLHAISIIYERPNSGMHGAEFFLLLSNENTGVSFIATFRYANNRVPAPDYFSFYRSLLGTVLRRKLLAFENDRMGLGSRRLVREYWFLDSRHDAYCKS